MEYWRLLELEYDDPYMNVALEEAIMRCVGREASPCTLRFWRNPRAVVIGSFQHPGLEVDLEACRRRGIPVIRRISGGGAVYHDLGNLNYSIFLPRNRSQALNRFAEVFEGVTRAVAESLRRLGLDAAYQSRDSVLVGGRKISGLAGAVKYGVFLVHGSLLVNSDLTTLYEALGFSRRASKVACRREYTRSKMTKVTSLEESLGYYVSMDVVKKVLRGVLESLFSAKFQPSGLNEYEEKLLIELFENKYNLKGWNLKYFNESCQIISNHSPQPLS